MTAVIVVGAGPAGRALAHRLTRTGVSVTVIDPTPEHRWTATYGCWSDELPGWLGEEPIAARTPTISARAHGTHHIARGYTVLNTAALQSQLSLAETEVVSGRVGDMTPTSVHLTDGATLDADTVIDCRGLRNPAAARQTAFGVVVSTDDAAPLLDGAPAVLMDWSPPTGNPGNPGNLDHPSFLYAVPLGDDEVLLEETCLAGRPALGLDALRQRLEQRLGDHPMRVRRIERVSFALTAQQPPWQLRQPVRFGAAGGLLHPATGYSLGTTLAATDAVARAVAGGQCSVDTLWPPTARGAYQLRHRGLDALLALSGQQLVGFFDAFLALPPHVQRGYLSGYGDLPGTLRAMARVFAGVDSPTRRRLMSAVAGRSLSPSVPPQR